MGCGASNDKAEPANTQQATKEKYEKKEEPVSPTKGAGNTPAEGDKEAASPSKKKKNKGGGRYGNPDYHNRLFKMTDLFNVEENQTTSMFMLSTNKVVLKTEPAKKQQEVVKEFAQVARGEMAVMRAPPTDNAMLAEVHSDFCPPFSLALTDEEVAGGAKLGGDCFVMDGVNPQQLVQPRLAATTYKRMSLRVLTSFNRPISAIGLSNDGRMVAIAQVRAKAIEPHRGGEKPPIAPLAEVKGGSRGSVSSMTSLLNRFKIDAFSRTVRLHDLRTGMMVGYMKEKSGDPEVTADFAFPLTNPEGLMSCTTDGTLIMWHTGKFRLVKKCVVGEGFPNPTRYTKLVISNNGKYMLGAADDLDDDAEDTGQVIVYAAEQGGFKHLHSFRNQHKHLVTSVGVSPNNDLAVSGDAKGTVMVWHLETGELKCKVLGHMCNVRTCFFLPSDPTKIITVCERYVRCWDISNADATTRPTPLWTRFFEENEPQSWAKQLEEWGGDEDEDEEENEEINERQSPRYMNPMKIRSKHRLRLAMHLFSDYFLFAGTTREAVIVHGPTGEEIDRFSTKGVLSCGSCLRNTAVLGDSMGIVYCVDFTTSHELPAFT